MDKSLLEKQALGLLRREIHIDTLNFTIVGFASRFESRKPQWTSERSCNDSLSRFSKVSSFLSLFNLQNSLLFPTSPERNSSKIGYSISTRTKQSSPLRSPVSIASSPRAPLARPVHDGPVSSLWTSCAWCATCCSAK